MFRNLTRLGDLRLSTNNCWRQMRTSASREAENSSIERSASKILLSNPNIAVPVSHSPSLRHADQILTKYKVFFSRVPPTRNVY